MQCASVIRGVKTLRVVIRCIFHKEKIMAKFFGKNNYANMPQEVVRKEYPKQKSIINEGTYVDTQEEMDKSFEKASSILKKNLRK